MNEPTPADRGDDYLARIRAAGEQERIDLCANWLLREFDDYYRGFQAIPALARSAFERRDPRTSLALSKARLSIYSESISALGERLKRELPEVAGEPDEWARVQARYLEWIEGRYEADLAFAYIHSVSRKVHEGDWQPVEYGFGDAGRPDADGAPAVFRRFTRRPIHASTVAEILRIPGFERSFRSLDADAGKVAARLELVLASGGLGTGDVRAVEVIDAGFYRNRGAYVVGRMVFSSGSHLPLVLALENAPDGIFVDAVLTSEADVHNIFSSTLANFHVTHSRYHELCAFLHDIMPRRPLGLHYSTIGFNHIGKVAVMNELQAELERTGERLQPAAGVRGTVAIGFAAPTSAYLAKVIRDRPVRDHDHGAVVQGEAVLESYRRVHQIDRAGSMLDSIIFHNLRLDPSWFDSGLLDELLREASQSVSLHGSDVVFRSLIVQRRMTPLPVFLETASDSDAETVIANLGQCIKNNAAGNIFNRDLDARNYGVSRLRKVYLYDHDALVALVDVAIEAGRDTEGRGEVEPPRGDGDRPVFRPESIDSRLRLPNRQLRQLLRDLHGDLCSVEYWLGLQAQLESGKVPEVSVYPASEKLR